MFKMSGFEEVQKRLEDMAKRAAELDGKRHEVSLSELLNDDFIAEHSSFNAFNALLAASPFLSRTQTTPPIRVFLP